MIDYRPRHAKSLALSPREAAWCGIGAIAQTDPLQRGVCPAQCIAMGVSSDLQRQHDVIQRATVLQQLLILEHQSELAS